MRSHLIHLFLLIIGLYLVVSLSRSIFSLTLKTKAVDEARRKVDIELVENSKLAKELTQTQGQEFIEKVARDKLNMSKKGETVVVVPQDLADNLASINATLSASFWNPPEIIPNWKKWLKLFW